MSTIGWILFIGLFVLLHLVMHRGHGGHGHHAGNGVRRGCGGGRHAHRSGEPDAKGPEGPDRHE